MATFHDLATELKFEIFQHLTLISLIRARCVCREWRDLALDSDLHPVRRQFYEIYLNLIDSPEFLASRQYVLKQLDQGVQERHQAFDRQGFIDAILKQHPYIPEDFTIWILEWPERAVIGSVWPNLPFEEVPEAVRAGGSREGWNFLANEPVAVFSLRFAGPDWDNPALDAPRGPALPIWEGHYRGFSVWLVLDDHPDRQGKVYRLLEQMWTDETGPVIDLSDEPDYLAGVACEVISSWTEYLRGMVHFININGWYESGGYMDGRTFERYRMIGGDLDDRASRWAPDIESTPLRKQGRKQVGDIHVFPR